MTPMFSVVVPAYNAGRTIRRALQSVFEQSLQDFEIVVCDDGSTDTTAALLEDIRDTRLHVVRQPNSGRGAARNRALERATGRYVALLDADDWWDQGKLAGDLAVLEGLAEPALVYSNLHVVNAAGHIFRLMNGKTAVAHSGRVFPLLLQSNFVPTSTICVPRQIALAVGPFDTSIVRGQDWEWLLRAAAIVPFRYRNQPVGYYDAHSWGSDEKTVATWEGVIQLLDKVRVSLADLVAQYPDALARSYASAYVSLARYREGNGDHDAAAQLYACALEHTPQDERVAWSRIMALYACGDWAHARALLVEQVARAPWSALPRFYLGNVALALDQPDQALEQFERATYVGPRDQQFPECVNNLGVACWRIGDLVRARELFEQALQQREFYSDALWNLAQLSRPGAADVPRWTRRKAA